MRITGKQLWIGALIAALFVLLWTGKYAYDAGAFGAGTPALVTAAVWAVGIVTAVAGFLGIQSAVQQASRSLVLRLLRSRGSRLAIIAVALALSAWLVHAARNVPSAQTWSCAIQGQQVKPPDRSRCGEGSFAQMRSFKLRLERASDADDQPTLCARVADRAVSSVAVDSDRGGLCVATGPDQPTRGESRLALSADCGADRVYVVNVHLCDVKVIESTLQAAAQLEIREGNHASVVTCD